MKRVLILLGGALVLSFPGGCADTRQGRVATDFGTSQRLAVFDQTYDIEAGRNLEPVIGLDGQAADAVVVKYRESFKVKAAPSTNLTINVGK